MDYDCYCDYDPPEFHESKRQKARKQHKCCECGGIVVPGEVYDYAVGKWEGDLLTFKTCERCTDLYMWVKNNVPCVCYVYEDLNEQMDIAVYEAWNRAPKETVGLRFGYLRRKVARRKFNEARKRELTRTLGKDE